MQLRHATRKPSERFTAFCSGQVRFTERILPLPLRLLTLKYELLIAKVRSPCTYVSPFPEDVRRSRDITRRISHFQYWVEVMRFASQLLCSQHPLGEPRASLKVVEKTLSAYWELNRDSSRSSSKAGDTSLSVGIGCRSLVHQGLQITEGGRYAIRKVLVL